MLTLGDDEIWNMQQMDAEQIARDDEVSCSNSVSITWIIGRRCEVALVMTGWVLHVPNFRAVFCCVTYEVWPIGNIPLRYFSVTFR